jgi:hypothetical protein
MSNPKSTLLRRVLIHGNTGARTHPGAINKASRRLQNGSRKHTGIFVNEIIGRPYRQVP